MAPTPPRVSNVRFMARLTFIAVLGGLSALAAISHLCTTAYSTSAYCSSASTLQERVLSNLTALDIPWTPTCTSNCMDSTNGAEIIYSHLRHIHFMMDLLEGTGLRETHRLMLDARIFDDVARDVDRKALLDNLTAFSEHRKDVGRQFERFLGSDFAVTAEFIIQDFKYAIEDLNATTAYERDTNIFILPNRRAIVDDTLRSTLDTLVHKLEVRFTLLAMGIPSLLEVVSQLHAHGQRISEELEAEIPRVREAYENIPWWQSITPIEILGEGTRRKVFTSYHDFLSAKVMYIREGVEHAAIVYDHFAMLRGYFTWYKNGPPSGRPEAGRGRTVARLLEVMEDLEYRMSSIRTAKISAHRFTCPRLQLL